MAKSAVKAGREVKATAIQPVTNGAQEQILYEVPYQATVTIKGSSDILFHAWNNEAVEAKAKAAKGSKAKKTDDLESYVYRCENGNLGVPGVSLRGALVNAGRYRQDPRSPRKSAMDLLKAGVIPVTLYADTGCKDWDFVSTSSATRLLGRGQLCGRAGRRRLN